MSNDNIEMINPNKQQLELLKSENKYLKERIKQLEDEKKCAAETIHRRVDFMKMLNMLIYTIDLNLFPYSIEGAINEITGYTEADFLNGIVCWEKLVHPEDVPVFKAYFENILKGRIPTETLEYRIISGDGQTLWLNDRASLVKDEANVPIAIEGLVMDVTRRKLAEEEFSEREAHLDSILNSVQDVIWSVTPDTFELIYINPATEIVYGYKPEKIYNLVKNHDPRFDFHYEMLLNNFTDLLQKGWFEAEFSITRSDGEIRWLRRRAHFAKDAHGVLARIDGIDSDITARKLAEDKLKYISLHDNLTGLYNRFYFENHMHLLDDDPSIKVGLIVCDIDGLKMVNDTLGHEVGDELLILCTQILNETFGDDAIISRIGGDEFTIILKNITNSSLQKYMKDLEKKSVEYSKIHTRFPICISTGFAIRTDTNTPMNELFRKADNMMYAQKATNRAQFYKIWTERTP